MMAKLTVAETKARAVAVPYAAGPTRYRLVVRAAAREVTWWPSTPERTQ
ncbi:MAG TPA: hypothetical protein VFY90_06170 [Tepidiformaceae bacterium]|nr:hypothetical protein [Tepidiformaceae bacterium]